MKKTIFGWKKPQVLLNTTRFYKMCNSLDNNHSWAIIPPLPAYSQIKKLIVTKQTQDDFS
jgi:hypothetical protein